MDIKRIDQIPFLPVELFKGHRVVCGNWTPEITFSSSTTTGGTPSLHHVQSKAHYESVYIQGFEQQYGAIKDWTVLALLPSYLERSGSSLLMMAEGMIERSRDTRSGFYLYNHGKLLERLRELGAEKKPTLLLGVTFAHAMTFQEGTRSLSMESGNII